MNDDIFDKSMMFFAWCMIPLIILAENKPKRTRQWAMVGTFVLVLPLTAIFALPFALWMFFVAIPMTMFQEA